MKRSWLRFLGVLGLVIGWGRYGWAFEGFSNDPGSHMYTLGKTLQKVFGSPLGTAQLVKTMPVYGIKEYRWDPYYAANLMADAARDIDMFFFGPLYPHAQTKSFSYKKKYSSEELIQIETAALREYIQHMHSGLSRVRHLLESADTNPRALRDGLYLLGVLTHSYQDLWAHRGITNEMHKALLKHRGLDVDRDPQRIQEMERRLEGWLSRLPLFLGPVAGERLVRALQSEAVFSVPTVGERKKILGRGRDIFVQGIVYVLFTSDGPESLSYLDAVQWDVDTLDTILSDPQLLQQAAACATEGEFKTWLNSQGYRF